jgi:hypothetical protein
MAVIKQGLGRSNKRTWPIKGRGLGVIAGGESKLMQDIADGFKPNLIILEGIVGVSNSHGKTFYYPTSKFRQMLDEAGVRCSDVGLPE